MTFDFMKKIQEQAKSAIEASRSQPAAASASAAPAAPTPAQLKGLVEDALENAGISGVDVTVDASGFTKLVGEVPSEEKERMAVAIVEAIDGLTGLDAQLHVVTPAADPADQGPPAPDVATQGTTYKTKKGDSWWGISARFYGDGRRWKELKRANGWPNMLHPNVDVTIPPASELSKWKEA